MSQSSNFEIPARFSFRPFTARWEICTAELMGWCEIPPHLMGGMAKPILGIASQREKVSVRIEVPDYSTTSGMLTAMGLGPCPSQTMEIFREDIPSDVLRPDENRKSTPDIAGREFEVLLCQKPEFKTLFPSTLKPGDTAKNAWAMRREFFDLDEGDWFWSLRHFLNRWGLWSYARGFDMGMSSGNPTPGFVLVFPHLLRQKRDEFRKALEPRSSRRWLTTAPPLSFSTTDKPPYFLVERFYCEDAIQATITIDHLAGKQFGICKRHDCRKLFERTTRQNRLYCSPECAHLANVRKLRAKQRKIRSS